MTKKEMIQSMQQQEARLFLEAKKYEFLYGREDRISQAALGKWLGVHHLMESLGIATDVPFPETSEAVEYVVLISKRDKAAAEKLY
jgi:hypothetical protein